MDIISIIDRFVDLELECGQLSSSLSNAKLSLGYAKGKGSGFESSVDYAQKQVYTISREFEQKRNEHDYLKYQYISMAENMPIEALERVLNYLGNKSGQGLGYKSQAYGMVYNILYSTYRNRLGNFRRY